MDIDLTSEGIKSYWEKTGNAYELLLELEKKENWPIDDEVGPKDLKIIENILSHEKVDKAAHKLNELIYIISFTKASRALYIVDVLESRIEGVTVSLLLQCMDDIDAKADGKDVRAQIIYRDRIVALYRLDLLSQVFSSDRRKKIIEVMKDVANEFGVAK